MANYLIVGGSSGIGRALVDQLLQEGHQLQVWSREARDLPADRLRHIAVDVLEDDLPAEQLPEQLDGLVYCPGSIDLRPFRSLKPQQFRDAFELNVVGAVKCLQAAERSLKKSDQASVVLFSTVAVQKGLPFHASVAAAKGAVEGLTRSLAAEYAPRIRVNAIAPSLTDTPMAGKLLSSEDKRKASEDRHPLQRIGSPQEIAAMATFLLGNQAAFITAQVIGIDGGMGRL